MVTIKSILNTWPRVSLFVIFQAMFWSNWSGGSDPDTMFSLRNYANCVFAFVSMNIFFESIGASIQSKICFFENWASKFQIRLALGVTGSAYFISLLGMIGGLGWIGTIFILLITLVLALHSDRKFGNDYSFAFNEISAIPNSLWLLFAVSAVTFPFVFFPSDFSDPLYYHLRAPQSWYLQGSIGFDANNPLYFLAGVWEGVYLLAMQFFPTKLGYGQIEIQIICQALHFFTAVLLVRLFLQKIGEQVFGFDKMASRFAFLFLLLSASFWESATIAKNDWGILFLSAFCLCALMEYVSSSKLKYLVLFSFLLSIVGVSKFTVAVPLAIVGGALWIQRKAMDQITIQSFAWVLLGVLVGAAPVVIRNLFYISTPLFPIGAEAVLSRTDQLLFSAFRSYPGEYSVSEYFAHFADLLAMVPIVVSVVLLYFLRGQIRWPILIAIALSIAFHASFVDLVLNWRLVGILVPFMIFLGMSIVDGLLKKFRFSAESHFFTFLGILIMTAASSGLARKVEERVSSLNNPAMMIREHKAGDAMAWARMHKKFDSQIYFGGNNLLFHLPGFKTVTIETNPVIDNALIDAKSGEQMITVLRELGADFFVESYGPVAWGRTAKLLNPIVNRCRECIVFAGVTSRVVDMESLLQFIEADGYVPQPIKDRGYILPKQK